MEKTQKILKRFISLILTFAISFGSYVFPVFAALPEDNEAPTIAEVVEAYDDLNDKKLEVNGEITDINSTNPAPDSPKAKAVDEVKSYLAELNNTFTNEISGVATPNTLKVKTTAYNVITVIIDFNDTTNLGITLTNETMKQQVLTDTYSMLQEHYYQLDFMYKYLNKAVMSETYFNSVDEVGTQFEKITNYIEILDELDITYDKNLYETYALELAKLMIVEVTNEDIQKVNKLANDLNTYESSLVSLVKSNISEKLNEFKTVLDNTTLTGTEIDNIKLFVTNAVGMLQDTNTSNDDIMMIASTYILAKDDYEHLEEQNNIANPTTDYIDSKIAEINKMIAETFDLNITIEQIETIENLMINNPNISMPIEIEELVANMDADGLSEKLISGELSYETLEAFVKFYNNHYDVLQKIRQLSQIVNSQELSDHFENAINKDIFGSNGGYMDELNAIENTSKTDEERLEILNKLDLTEKSVLLLGEIFFRSSDDEALTPITDKIKELREFYNKSCDNTLTDLTINGIEMDVTEEKYKVYVGNDVTELKVLFEKSNPNAKVEVLNAKDLKVGSNEVIVVVTAENGEVRQYVIEVIRAEAAKVVTTTENKTDDEVKPTSLNNDVVEDTEVKEEKEHKNTSDSNEKYDKEVKEERLSAFTVLLIVIAIALVGYGVYKLFGNKEDKKIEKAFEKPKTKPNNNKPNPKQNKKNHKKRK